MATVKVLIPTPLRKFTGEADSVHIDADTVGSLLNTLVTVHDGLAKPLIDEEGKPRRFVNLYVNGEDIRFLQGTETPLGDGDELSIVPAIAGGVTPSGGGIYNLTFTRAMFEVPILHNLGKRFRLTVNIRRAMLSEDAGWAEVELNGTIEEIGRAIAYLQTTGVSVTGPISDAVAPDFEQYIPATIGRGT
ncbi:MAG: MoaD/ThiS family protein [Capsulimonadales bacterium]|nr:MoaD/ThiS family protein [Capsulimonadales bacterium]